MPDFDNHPPAAPMGPASTSLRGEEVIRESLGGSKVLWSTTAEAPRIGPGNRLTAGDPPKHDTDRDGQKDGDKNGDDGKAGETGKKLTRKKGDDGDKPKKKPLYKRPVPMIIIISVLLLAAIFATIYVIHARHFISTDDAFIEGHVIQVSPKVAALVADVRIDDNYLVKQGQVLVKLDPRDFEASLAQVKANRSSLAGKLEEANSNKTAALANVTEAQAELEVAQANYENAKRDFERYAALDERARSKQQLDNSTASERVTSAQVDQAKARIAAMNAQVANADSAIITAQADLAKADADVQQAELNLGYCTILAPEDGYITAKSVEPGAYVSVGQALFSLVPKTVWVVANYKETELDHIRHGQPVTISIDAFPEKKYHGNVDSVQAGAGAAFSLLPPENATGNYIKVVQRVPVKIDIDPKELGDPVHILGPGMSVEPSVDVRNALH